MADYIKRSDVLKLARIYYTPVLREEAVPVKAIKNIPSADVAPVKHGFWENSYRKETDSYVLACSCCGSANSFGYTRSNYCPNCGARMDGGT